MDRNKQLKFCRVCKNKKFDVNSGIICGLTNATADFIAECDSFEEDLNLKQQYEQRKKELQLLNTASSGKRFCNYLLDRVVFIIFFFFLGIVLGIFAPDSLILEEDNKLYDYLLCFVFGVIYYTIFEASTGRTFGKLITKTKVVNENGMKPSFSSILIRSFCRFIPLNAFSFLGSDAIGWHDTLSGTRVVDVD